MRWCRVVMIALMFVAACRPLVAQDEAKTHEVKERFFQVVETIDAVVESRNMVPLAVDTENWTDLEIETVVPEGTAVRPGEVIVEFDKEKISRKIRESEQALQLAELTLRGTELEVRQLEQTLPLDQALADRKRQNAEQDYEYFKDVEKPNQERTVRRGVENSQHSLEYAQEEYNQLKRMYEEDELTEESEEIVLKRTERDVENRQFFLEQAQIKAARTLDFDLPREMEQKTDALERARLEHERAQVMLPLEKSKKGIEFEKSRFAMDKEARDLEQLRSDLQRMTVQAPAAGVVYYGRCVRGAWLGQSGPQRNLEPGGSVVHDKTMITLVDPDDLMLRADLTEKQLAFVRPGTHGLAKSEAFPDLTADITVTSVSYVPVQSEKFDCQLDLGDGIQGLMPGMKCKVRFLVRQNERALTVPETAVFTDDGIEQYVFVTGADADAEPQRRVVVTGWTADKMTEITSGLAAGDQVLLERPE